MSKEPSQKCSRCGATLPADAPQGLCPRCLGAFNFAEETAVPGVAAPAQPPPSPEDIAPHFPQLEILECLGRGGMGVVYKARQKALGRPVALKILAPERGKDPEFAARFTREAQALARLNHPHIVTIHDFGQADGFFYLLMEFVDGVNLRQAMRAGRFTPQQALAVVPQICEALQFAHDRGIVHRDIKPENILLDRHGRVKIADFGVAKIFGSEAPAAPEGEAAPAGLTQAKGVVGTPRYMAPEQVTHPLDVDHRADIYSLGVVLYEMLTGELPAARIEAPSKKVVIDVRLDEVVLRALEKEPEFRYQQARVLGTEVETIATTLAPLGVPAGAHTVGKSWQSPPSGWGHFIGYLFGSTFTSPLAFKLANLSALGFLCFLGFMPLPGWGRCFGFSGFFGLIGFAFLVEMVARSKAGRAGASPRPMIVVGRRGNKAVIHWPGVLLGFALTLAVMEVAAIVMSQVLEGRIDTRAILIACLFALMITGIRIRRGRTTPLDRLLPLDEPRPAAEKGDTPPVAAKNLPIFVEREGRRHLHWPGVLMLCGTVGLVVGGVTLAIALVLWLVTAEPWPLFHPRELPWVIVLLAVCVLMRVAGSRLCARDGDPGRPDWRLWSPLQPPMVQEICAHMTEGEKREAAKRCLLFSLWNAMTFFGPFFCVMFMSLPSPMNWIYGGAILIVGLSFYPLWLQMAREFLCSTAWARRQEIKPDQLKRGVVGCPPKSSGGPFWNIPIVAALAALAAFAVALAILGFMPAFNPRPAPPPLEPPPPMARASGPVITRLVFTGNGVFIEGRGSADSWLIISVGKDLLSMGVVNDPHFTATIERAWFGGGLNCVVKASSGKVLSAAHNSKIGIMTKQRGQIIFREGTPALEPDGPYVIGEFRPAKGAPVPVTVGLEKARLEWMAATNRASGPISMPPQPPPVPAQKTVPKRANSGRPSVSGQDGVIVEDLALRLCAAIRDKEDAVLKELATDRVPGWRDALPAFAFELRERFTHLTGKPFGAFPEDSLVDGDFAVVRCTGPEELQGKCLVLGFVRTPAGWRNWNLRNSTEDVPLQRHLDDFKAQLEKQQP